jgi:hypothetical protein
VLAVVTTGLEKLLPPAAGKTAVDGKAAAYVCRNFTCDAPTTDPADLEGGSTPGRLPGLDEARQDLDHPLDDELDRDHR